MLFTRKTIRVRKLLVNMLLVHYGEIYPMKIQVELDEARLLCSILIMQCNRSVKGLGKCVPYIGACSISYTLLILLG